MGERLAGLSPPIHVATLARRYLAVEALSAASEHIFSLGGLVVTKTRNRLSGGRVGDIVVLHESMKYCLR